MQPDDPSAPGGPDPVEEEEQRRRRQADSGESVSGWDAAETAGDAGEVASDGCSVTDGCGGDNSSWSCDGCDGCNSPCDGCDFLMMIRLSTLLVVAARVVPDAVGRPAVRSLVRFYRRWLTRFTVSCPSTPSCSTYALAAVESLGARRGLVAAAERIRGCGRT